jgi:hypothetical protein
MRCAEDPKRGSLGWTSDVCGSAAAYLDQVVQMTCVIASMAPANTLAGDRLTDDQQQQHRVTVHRTIDAPGQAASLHLLKTLIRARQMALKNMQLLQPCFESDQQAVDMY